MDIAYSTRSKFLEACEAAIRAHRADLESGETVYVDLGEGGYDGQVVVSIRQDDRATFGTDWTSTDVTWFPARIKAAATALLNCRCEGAFAVSHADGSLAIRQVMAAEFALQPTSPTVYLVSCVSQKREHACAARDLYTSDWFCKARRYAEASECPWFILSAEYGLVPPDQVVTPYERTLNTMRVADRRAWAERVARQLAEAVPDLSYVVFLAGERYREFLTEHLAGRGVAVSVPMEGLRIGEQLNWLGQHSPQ